MEKKYKINEPITKFMSICGRVLPHKNEPLENENNEFQERYSKLSEDYKNLINEFNQTKENHQNEINKFLADKQSYIDEIEGLKNTISNLEEEKNELFRLINVKDDNIDNLNSQLERKHKDLEQMIERTEKNRDKNILKAKADNILKICEPYENFERALSSMSNVENMQERNKLVIEELESVINSMKTNNVSEEDIDGNDDLINQLNNILSYLKDSNDYIENNEIFKEGIILTNKLFREAFESMGLKEIPTKGEKLNVDFHEPLKSMDYENFEDGCIIKELGKGYMLNDVVIKRAKVVYCKKS